MNQIKIWSFLKQNIASTFVTSEIFLNAFCFRRDKNVCFFFAGYGGGGAGAK